jgi:hypothetical protein
MDWAEILPNIPLREYDQQLRKEISKEISNEIITEIKKHIENEHKPHVHLSDHGMQTTGSNYTPRQKLEPCKCDHWSHKGDNWIGSNKWRVFVGLDSNPFCPKCGAKLEEVT